MHTGQPTLQRTTESSHVTVVPTGWSSDLIQFQRLLLLLNVPLTNTVKCCLFSFTFSFFLSMEVGKFSTEKNTWSPSYSWKMVRSGNPCTHSQVNYQLEKSIAPSTRRQVANLVTLLSRNPQFISSTPHCTPGLPTLVARNPNKTLQSMCRLLLPRSYFNILLCGPVAKAKFILLNWLHFALDMIMS